MTDLWLVRHGDAVAAEVAPERPLSAAGAAAVARAAAALSGRMGRFDLVASSGKRRARQTAEILAAAAGYPADRIVDTDALGPNAPAESFLRFLAESGADGSALCVGHRPSLADFASFFLTTGEPLRLDFGAGTVCRIRLSALRRGGGELILLF